MSNDSYFMCECDSKVLAVSHTWAQKANFEEVGFVGEDGRYIFDDAETLKQEDLDHEWITYCGGCGKGIILEWLDDGRVRVVLGDESVEDAEIVEG